MQDVRATSVMMDNIRDITKQLVGRGVSHVISPSSSSCLKLSELASQLCHTGPSSVDTLNTFIILRRDIRPHHAVYVHVHYITIPTHTHTVIIFTVTLTHYMYQMHYYPHTHTHLYTSIYCTSVNISDPCES